MIGEVMRKRILLFAGIAIAALVLCRQATTGRGSDFPLPVSVTIKAITYNICGLPDQITKERDLDPARKRFPRIGEKLRGYDVIGLQETFVPERISIERKLRSYFVARGTDSWNKSTPGSGIYIFSRGRIPRSTFEMWEGLVGADSWSHKGFVGATTELRHGFAIDVYSLHGAASGGSELRRHNYEQLLNGMKRFSGGSGRPVLVLGDFNCELKEPECQWLLANSNLKHVDPAYTGIDHIFYDENGSDWNISVQSAGEAFITPDARGRLLSDHPAFEAALKFDKKTP
jgi:endonuclease/exonuclease/phosphatase family metal-dependent hydrolase